MKDGSTGVSNPGTLRCVFHSAAVSLTQWDLQVLTALLCFHFKELLPRFMTALYTTRLGDEMKAQLLFEVCIFTTCDGILTVIGRL